MVNEHTLMNCHDDLLPIAERWLSNTAGCGVVLREPFRAMTNTGETPDAIGWRQHVSILIECKYSRADFLSDKSKKVRQRPQLGMGDWRFYLCPPKVIQPEDLPEGWGLLWTQGGPVRKVFGFPPNARWRRARPFVGNKVCEQQLMYSALRRIEIRGQLGMVYERL